ncbi:efflux RND transporter periplasmic adaptor subunit [Cupriavidus basilensis]
MKRTGRRWTALLPVAAAWALAACGKQEAPPAAQQAVPVQVVKTVAQDLPVTFEFVGQTQSDQAVDIRGRVSGFLVKRAYVEGAMVRPASCCSRSTTSPSRPSSTQPGRNWRRRARLEVARANLARVKPLAERNALSAKDLDDATGNYHAAAAGVEQARAQVEEQQLNLSYTYALAGGWRVQLRRAAGGRLREHDQQPADHGVHADADAASISVSPRPQTLPNSAPSRPAAKMVPPPDQHYAVTVVLADGSRVSPQGPHYLCRCHLQPAEPVRCLVRAEMPNPEGTLRPTASSCGCW